MTPAPASLATAPDPVACSSAALGRLLPLHARLDAGAVLRGLGPTLRKLTGAAALGQPLASVLIPVHPARVTAARDLLQDAPLRLVLRGSVPTPFKGVAVPLADGGVLVNLSFSYRLQEAVRDHRLSGSDFAPTDLANELLYLAEANAAILAAARRASDGLRGARAQALEQALTDPLTGLRNRRGLDRALDRLSRSGQPFGLIHIDLDHFKKINDTWGHPVGDQLLVEVAARLRQVVRDADAIARLGGDEFVVLLLGQSDPERVRAVAQRILQTLRQPVALPPPSPAISASLGVAVCDGAAPARIDDLLMAADRALYRSKEAGRGRVTLASPSAPG